MALICVSAGSVFNQKRGFGGQHRNASRIRRPRLRDIGHAAIVEENNQTEHVNRGHGRRKNDYPRGAFRYKTNDFRLFNRVKTKKTGSGTIGSHTNRLSARRVGKRVSNESTQEFYAKIDCPPGAVSGKKLL